MTEKKAWAINGYLALIQCWRTTSAKQFIRYHKCTAWKNLSHEYLWLLLSN